MAQIKPSAEQVEAQVAAALAEDVGSGDVTAALVPADARAQGQVLCRDAATLSGCDWFETALRQCTDDLQIQWQHRDGDVVAANSVLCMFSGNARGLLTGERTGLNFLQLLSATASVTAEYVKACKDTSVKLLDTRKTIPGLRLAQKYAVHCGGGVNHRIGLYDAFLIKENHILAAGSIAAAVSVARNLDSELLLEVEVESLAELRQALAVKVDRVLLDNFSNEQLREAVRVTAGACELEASGGVTLSSVGGIAATGVDYISVGALTKDVRAIDLSMRLDV